MKKVERVQKVNVISLTDGEANPHGFMLNVLKMIIVILVREYKKLIFVINRNKVFFLRDPKTGYSRKINPSPYELQKRSYLSIREITDYNWIGIRICSKGELTRLVR